MSTECAIHLNFNWSEPSYNGKKAHKRTIQLKTMQANVCSAYNAEDEVDSVRKHQCTPAKSNEPEHYDEVKLDTRQLDSEDADSIENERIFNRTSCSVFIISFKVFRHSKYCTRI